MATEKRQYIPVTGQNIPPQELLKQLVIREQHDQEATSGPFDFDTRKKLFTAVKLTPTFGQRYREAINFLLVPRSPEEQTEFRNELEMTVLDGVARLYCLSTQPPLILSSEYTTAFYHKLYPRVRRLKPSFGSSYLVDFTAPQAVAVEKTPSGLTIPRAYHFSLSARAEYYSNSLKALVGAKERHPNIFEGTKIAFIIPEGLTLPAEVQDRREVDLVPPLPFNRDQFKNFIDDLYQEYSIEPGAATLMDFQQEARIQAQGLPRSNSSSASR